MVPNPGGTTLGGEDDSMGDMRLDMGVQAGTDGRGEGEGVVVGGACEKVDLLFVIDNSGSMEDEQEHLVASFPGFVSTMQAQLADAESYHVAVVTSDSYRYDAVTCNPFGYGTFVVQTGGDHSSSQNCGPFAGGRFMTEADDLATRFGCAAKVGIEGSGDEKPMTALIEGLQAGASDGGCNGGFLRDDALLVVVIITDENDDFETETLVCSPERTVQPQSGSSGDPDKWFDSVVALKGGIESNVVVLSLVGPDGDDACEPLDKCAINGGVAGAEPSDRILAFTRKFTHSFVGPVCSPTYDTFFQEATNVIQTACETFTPAGPL